MTFIFDARFPFVARLPKGLLLLNPDTGQLWRPGGRWGVVLRPTTDGQQVVIKLVRKGDLGCPTYYLAPAAAFGFTTTTVPKQEQLFN